MDCPHEAQARLVKVTISDRDWNLKRHSTGISIFIIYTRRSPRKEDTCYLLCDYFMHVMSFEYYIDLDFYLESAEEKIYLPPT